MQQGAAQRTGPTHLRLQPLLLNALPQLRQHLTNRLQRARHLALRGEEPLLGMHVRLKELQVATLHWKRSGEQAMSARRMVPDPSSQHTPHPADLHGCIHRGVAAQGDPVDGLGGRAQVRGDDQALEAVHKLREGGVGWGWRVRVSRVWGRVDSRPAPLGYSSAADRGFTSSVHHPCISQERCALQYQYQWQRQRQH